MMSLKRNAIANYIGQSYSILIAIVITPLYLQYLGVEAYGVVGFFALMQAWLNLLDLGLSPTLGRQVAYARGRVNGFELFKRLLKSFELIFFGLTIVIVVSVFVLSAWISQVWIKSELLDAETLVYCVSLMGVMIGLRWFSGLYRSGINGLEDQVWLSLASTLLISLKFIGALILLVYITHDLRHFFEYQLIIGVIELLIFAWRFYSQLPKTERSPSLVAFDWIVVKSVLPFSLSIAYSAGIWILITQVDKLILSGVLSLAEFGYFSLVALVAGGVTALSAPISQALIPRMTLLISQGKEEEMFVIYRQASQVVLVVALSVSLMVGLYAEQLIYAWTGVREAAAWGADVLIWFVLGNGILAIGAFQYYLQSAFGQLRLHVIGSTLSAFIQVPIIYFAAVNYGAVGAGMAWFGFRLIWFLWWTPIVHRRFVPGFHVGWMMKDILPIAFTTTMLALAIHYAIPLSLMGGRFIIFVEMTALGCVLLMMASFSAPFIRERIFQVVKK